MANNRRGSYRICTKSDKLPFYRGTFTFNDNGSLSYVNAANVNYQGKWEIVKRIIDEKTVRRLQISAIDFTTQQILTEYYDDMNFISTNHFNAKIISNFNTYVTHFHR